MYRVNVKACLGILSLAAFTCAALTRPSEIMSLLAMSFQVTVIAYVVLTVILDWPSPNRFALAFAVSSIVFAVIDPLRQLWLPSHVLNRIYELLFGSIHKPTEHVRHFHTAARSLLPIYAGMLLGIVLIAIHALLRNSHSRNTDERDSA